jgi:hypothetical protein
LAAALSARPRGFIEQWTARPETQAQLETIGTVLDHYAQQLLDRALYENILAQEQEARQAVLSQLRRAMRPSARPSETELRRGGAATWGEHPRPRLRLISRWPIIKGSLRSYATVEMPVGLKINAPGPVSRRSHNSQRMAATRSGPMASRLCRSAGMTGPRSRRPFSQAVVAAVRQAHPHDLSDE